MALEQSKPHYQNIKQSKYDFSADQFVTDLNLASAESVWSPRFY